LSKQLGQRIDRVREAYLQRALSLDDFASEDHLLGDRAPDDARQPLGAAEAGDQSKAHLGLPEGRVLGREDEVARHRQLTPAAEREPVHGGDHRLWDRLDVGRQALPEAREVLRLLLIHRLHLGDVGARDERAVTGAGEDHHARFAVVPELEEGPMQFRKRLTIQRVAHLRPIDRQRDDEVLALVEEVLEVEPRHQASTSITTATASPPPRQMPAAP